MITTIILTKDEEKNIVDAIESVLFTTEIIVIDDNSTDRTQEIVKNFVNTHSKVKLFTRELGTDFSAQRQFGIDKSENDWILFLDADERITPELATEIKENVTENTTQGGFLIQRRDFMWGKMLMHGETGRIRLLRLFNKKHGKLIGKVHEKWESNKEIGYLENSILHYPHPSISEFLKEINFYTDLRAEELYKSGKKAGFLSVIAYPKAKFFKNYFLKGGFLDGMPGLVHAVLMSLHSFLVRGKLWQLSNKT